MKSIAWGVISVFALDLPKLNSRLKKIENVDDKTFMVLFTFIADIVKVGIVFSVVMAFI